MKSSSRLFGTDGIRGPAGDFPLDQATVTTLGHELGRALREEGRQPLVVLGGDTRESTPRLAEWMASGLSGAASDIRFLGTVPTPTVAWACRKLGATGVAISASHNPWRDNGIKLIGEDGFKWSHPREAALESRLSAELGRGRAVSGKAALAVDDELVAGYRRALVETAPEPRALAGTRIAIDSANGAASALARPLFEALGAEVTILFDQPSGRNINLDCGSTHPRGLCDTVASGSFDLGVAFDGDADRALFVSERGDLVDGDAILYLWAKRLLASGALSPAAIVATSMSNLGLERALAREGIDVVRCDVGDRAVVDTLRERRLVLGGEQSGHIVHLGLSTTGDGLLTAAQVAFFVAAAPRPFSELLAGFETFPQVLKNLEVRAKPPLEGLPSVRAAVGRAEEQLGSDGRIVLRYSGTEPLARVMIEGPEQPMIEQMADDILAAIAAELAESQTG